MEVVSTITNETQSIVFSTKSNIKMKTICDYLKKGEHLCKGIPEEDLKTLFHTTKPPIFREVWGKERLMKNDFESLMIQFGMRVSIGVIRSRIEENTSDTRSFRIQTLTIESTDAKFILNTENPWNHEKICRRVIRQSTRVYMHKEKKRKCSSIKYPNTRQNYQSYEDCSCIEEDSTSDSNNSVQIECKNQFFSLR